MSYEDLKQSAALICEHVALKGLPILRATCDVPLEPEDSGWQFLCGVENHTQSGAQVWALRQVAELDTSVRVILDSEAGASFERSAVDTPWRSVPYDP